MVDGMVQATWRLTSTRNAATLRVEELRPLTRGQRAEIEGEGRRMLAFAAPMPPTPSNSARPRDRAVGALADATGRTGSTTAGAGLALEAQTRDDRSVIAAGGVDHA